MGEEKFQKDVKNAKYFAVGLGALIIIFFIINLLTGGTNIITRLAGILEIILIILTIVGYHKQKLYGPICGIIVSVLLIISQDIISLIFGILYLIDCIKILNYMRRT